MKTQNNLNGGYKVLIVGNKCYRCDHEWKPRNINKKSSVCPICKSPYWDKPKQRRETNG